MSEFPTRLSPAAALDFVRNGDAFLLDVRSHEEFAASHARDAVMNIPHTELAARAADLPKDRPVIAVCGSGGRSRVAVETLRSLGFSRVSDVEGGMRAWQAAGLPTVVTRKVMALDEQFRLIVGAFVLMFTLGGAFVSRRLLLGSAFIGFMLGLTALLGICPMMDGLRKMPWNRVR